MNEMIETTVYMAKVETPRNYKNCNHQPLPVVGFLGKLIACKIPANGFSKEGVPIGNDYIVADFAISELIAIYKK